MSHPLVLMVYNRPRHLVRVLEALERLKPEPLFVFSDGHQGHADQLKVEAVRMLISNIRWTQPIVHISHDHLGLRKSVVGAVDEVLAHHSSMIMLEDDCVPGPFFMDFMVRCLDLYESVPEVMSIGGYTIPLSDNSVQNHPWDAYFFPRVESWGWATWRRAWIHYERNYRQGYARARQLGIDLNCGGRDVPRLIRSSIKGEIDAWSIGWLLGTLINGGYTVYPTRSHITNIGFDGTGTHCGVSTRFDSPSAKEKSARFPPKVITNVPIYDQVRNFYGA